MTIEIFWQCLSIIAVSGAMLFFWYQICGMEYNFWQMLIRMLFYRDYKPVDWLIENYEYIGFACMFVAHFASMIGLLQQLGYNELHNKHAAFYFSSPVNNAGIVVACLGMLKKISRRGYRV